MADKEALLVVVGVDKPAGDALGAAAADLPRVGVEHADVVDPDPAARAIPMSGSPKTTNRLPSPVFLRSLAMCGSAFMRALRTGTRPGSSNSVAWASWLKARETGTSNPANARKNPRNRDEAPTNPGSWR